MPKTPCASTAAAFIPTCQGQGRVKVPASKVYFLISEYMLLLILVSNRCRLFSPANGFISRYLSSPRSGVQALQMSALERSVLRTRRCGEQGVLSYAPRSFWGVLLHHVCLGVLGIFVWSTRSCTEVSTSCSDRLVRCTSLLFLFIAGVAGED